MMKKVFIAFSVLLLIYMVWPGLGKISDFSPLPNSAKSTRSGDTTEIPNQVGYFSNNFREFVTNFYYNNYKEKTPFIFPPLKINHPPEYSWVMIFRNTDSTFLEEFVYPLRASLFVNGFETARPDGTPIFWGGPRMEEAGKNWYNKTTLRFYPANIVVRLIVWAEIIFSIFLICKLGKRIIRE